MVIIASGAARDAVVKIDNAAGTLTDISDEVTSFSLSDSKGVIDVTTFGDNARDYLAGIADATFSVELVYDPASGQAGSIIPVLALGSATQTVSWEIHPQGTASGKQKFSGEAYCTSYSPGGGLDDAVTASAQFQVTGAVAVANN